MKAIFFSTFLLLCLLYSFTQSSDAAVPCSTVDTKAAPCVSYATGKAPKPAAACCTGLQQLAQIAKTVDDRKAICRCLKAAVKNFGGVQDKFLGRIPAACNIKVGFPVSVNTDCEKIR